MRFCKLKMNSVTCIFTRRLLIAGFWTASIVCDFSLAHAQQPTEESNPRNNIRLNIQRAIAPIENAMLGYRENRRCFSCHHHAHAIVALSELSRRGFDINQQLLKIQFLRTVGRTQSVDQRYAKNQNIGGGVDTAGYALLAMRTGGHQPDETTESMVRWMLQKNPDEGFWSGTKNRAPTQTSDITRTWLCLDALGHFGSAALADQISERKLKSRQWLLNVKANSTEDKVSRIRALSVIGDAGAEIEEFADQLVKEQRVDGGWAQTDEMESDAYATGSVLMTLHQHAGHSTKGEFYQRGVDFLKSTQLADGTWHVKTRATPVQTYFESGFPHGRDQYISFTATCWAATAMALTLPEKIPSIESLTVSADSYQELQRRFQPRFKQEIWPLISDNGKSSCVRCHNEKHRSSLRLTGESENDFGILLSQGFLHPSDPSAILHSITSEKPNVKMPPKKLPKWTDEQVDILKRFTQDLNKAKNAGQ